MPDEQTRAPIFARHVRKLREDRGLSQAELGRRVGLGQSRVAAIEAEGSVNLDQAAAFAAALGVPLEMMLYEQPPPTRAVQLQSLYYLAERASQLRDGLYRLIEDIGDGMPGKLPDGTLIAGALPPRTGSE
jgi:transcriptional regulator with XRE-family HTH domain